MGLNHTTNREDIIASPTERVTDASEQADSAERIKCMDKRVR